MLSNTETELKKNIAYKKSVYLEPSQTCKM